MFLKEGVDLDGEQQEFYRAVSNYTTGVFYDSFTSTPELLTSVARALRALDNRPRALTWSPLTETVTPAWRRDFDPSASSNYSPKRAQVEVHVVGQPNQRRSTRQMSELASLLPSRIRAAGLVADTQPVDVNRADDGSLMGVIPELADSRRGGVQRIYPATATGLRLAADGQVSIWASLPADAMGAVVQSGDLTNQIAHLLRMIGLLDVIDSDTVAVGVGIDNAGMLAEGRVADLPRSRSSPLSMSDKPIHLSPDELVSIAALSAGAVEAAMPLAEALVHAVTRRR